MADHSKIEWTDATWNPITGCSIVSPGCTNCYAMRVAGRLSAIARQEHELTGFPGKLDYYRGTVERVKGKSIWTGSLALAPESVITKPLRWKRPRMIFVNSMGDLFHEDIPDEWIDRVFAVMALAPRHTFQVLTKRPKRMRDYLTEKHFAWGFRIMDAMRELAPPPDGRGVGLHTTNGYLPNVWLGVSAEDQKRADERIPDLLATPAAVRFVSAEPLLGPIDFTDIPWPDGRPRFPATDDISDGRSALHTIDGTRIDWIIVGGESGPGSRPMHPDWARSIRDQCQAAGVAFHFKQWGEWLPEGQRGDGTLGREPETVHVWPDRLVCARVGKKRAGRWLDGVEHDAFPGGSDANG